MNIQEGDVAENSLVLNFSDVEILGQELGIGAYAKVYTVKYRRITFAAKEIHETLQEGAQSALEKQTLKDNFLREYRQCSQLSHPNIVRGIGMYYKSQQLLPGRDSYGMDG